MGGKFQKGSVLILPDRLVAVSATSLRDTEEDVLATILDQKQTLDFALIGCGAQIERLPPGLQSAFETNKLPIDFMDTGAACRTYNVLLAEGRIFAALLMAVT